MENPENIISDAQIPPELPTTLPKDERYFLLLQNALRKCISYKPRFGQGRLGGLTAEEFTAIYGADPFYHWLGLDSPLVYAAHKAAGGMTSVYRQIGIGSQWIFNQILQDHLGLSAEQTAWNYTVKVSKGKTRTLSLDGRIDLMDVKDRQAQARFGHG